MANDVREPVRVRIDDAVGVAAGVLPPFRSRAMTLPIVPDVAPRSSAQRTTPFFAAPQRPIAAPPPTSYRPAAYPPPAPSARHSVRPSLVPPPLPPPSVPSAWPSGRASIAPAFSFAATSSVVDQAVLVATPANKSRANIAVMVAAAAVLVAAMALLVVRASDRPASGASESHGAVVYLEPLDVALPPVAAAAPLPPPVGCPHAAAAAAAAAAAPTVGEAAPPTPEAANTTTPAAATTLARASRTAQMLRDQLGTSVR